MKTNNFPARKLAFEDFTEEENPSQFIETGRLTRWRGSGQIKKAQALIAAWVVCHKQT